MASWDRAPPRRIGLASPATMPTIIAGVAVQIVSQIFPQTLLQNIKRHMPQSPIGGDLHAQATWSAHTKRRNATSRPERELVRSLP
jgi:hypothetical protein